MRVPWWFKIGAKLFLSRFPVAYRLWSRIGIFRHGRMGEDAYADDVFEFHLSEMDAAPAPRSVCLEIGPGDSLFTAVNANRAGFARSIMVDVGDFADRDLTRFVEVSVSRGLPPARATLWDSVDSALEDLDATYLTSGLAALNGLLDDSIDFAFSHAVLEHIRKSEYESFLRQLRRVLKPGAITSHQVDLQDHLEAGLNNLRFPDRVWETPFFAEAGFYTNRLSVSDHEAAFRAAGFVIEKLERQQFAEMPIARRALAEQFRARDSADLMVRGFHIVARA